MANIDRGRGQKGRGRYRDRRDRELGRKRDGW
jgi:hypothetical protein